MQFYLHQDYNEKQFPNYSKNTRRQREKNIMNGRTMTADCLNEGTNEDRAAGAADDAAYRRVDLALADEAATGRHLSLS